MIRKVNWPLVLILILAAFLFFFKLGFSTVWDQDEGQMLASSLEMVKSGEYLTPHLNSAIYFHKPPLYAWLTTILFKLFGFSEFLGRFWAAIFGIFGVYLTYRFGKTLYNERAGLLSAMIIASSPLYIVLSKMALVDVLLAFFITLSIYFFSLGFNNPNQKIWFYSMWLAMGFATMTKGPLGIIVPLASIVLFLAFSRRLCILRNMQWMKGLAIFLAVASPWFIIETMRHGSYFLKIIFGQFLFAIYMSPQQQHPGPFYYYIIVVLLGFLPWSGLFGMSLLKKPHGLLLSLFLVMLGLFSSASTKVPGYFLPAFPAMAIMTGAFLDKIFSGENKLAYYSGIILPIAILSAAAISIIYIKVPPQYAQAVLYLETLLLAALAGFFLSFLFSFIKPQPAWTIGGFVFSVAIFFIGLIGVILPYAEDFKPSYDLAMALKGRDHVAFYRTWLPPSLIFYLNRQKYPTVSVDIQDEKTLARFLKQKRSAAYVQADDEKAFKFPHRLLKSKASYVIIER